MENEFLAKINKYLFLFLLLIFVVTFFTRNNYRSVSEIVPDVLSQPLQRPIYSTRPLAFTKNDYAYEVTPLYYYEISGLIVRKMYYRTFSIEKFDKIFPMDLCLIWGSNVAGKVYRNTAINFSQDCRWCWAQWRGDVKFNLSEISNNHLLINNPRMESKIKSLVIGDQVKIKGMLVNIKANLVGKPGQFDSSRYSWNTSVSRADSGAGACEIIYVEDIVVLKKANIISYYLFRISLYGLLILIGWNIFYFFASPCFK